MVWFGQRKISDREKYRRELERLRREREKLAARAPVEKLKREIRQARSGTGLTNKERIIRWLYTPPSGSAARPTPTGSTPARPAEPRPTIESEMDRLARLYGGGKKKRE